MTVNKLVIWFRLFFVALCHYLIHKSKIGLWSSYQIACTITELKRTHQIFRICIIANVIIPLQARFIFVCLFDVLFWFDCVVFCFWLQCSYYINYFKNIIKQILQTISIKIVHQPSLESRLNILKVFYFNSLIQ